MNKIITLVSGGLDSTLLAVLAHEEGLEQCPLFINYGQRALDQELAACKRTMAALGLPEPRIADLAGFGALIRTGLTDPSMRVLEDAYTPGRNMLFLLTGAAYACQVGADTVSIGLLHEDTSLFPDQTQGFLGEAERMLRLAVDREITVVAPLAEFFKRDVSELAARKGIVETYSCHFGANEPCGACISCNEFDFEGA